ncbi:hypothetical protein KFL_001980060 [Klebsormidium nitens]|uniref:C2H2-type domain-containing protein n=1 Tax=Klebsormidium nitens TaxID=105231 RepID=A0A1Y1I138_KLENI|nr:hypothetical protein KFL_001980060 [Klebsormidium nitens]|eukprot:GAQ84624.1 hypothetical protein KFL_001980060 [Klebsormidium nitens]
MGPVKHEDGGDSTDGGDGTDSGRLRKKSLRGASGKAACSLRLEQQQPEEEQVGTSSERQHICEVCAIAFSKPAHLRQHLVIHTGQRPFPCPHAGCARTFKRQDHLRRHLLSHSQPVLPCPIPGCPVTCSLPDNLRAHVKRHQAACFRCSEPECTFETAFKRQLWEHTRSCHASGHMCQEPGCSKRFKFRSLLTAHQASVHGFTANRAAPLVSNIGASSNTNRGPGCKDAQECSTPRPGDSGRSSSGAATSTDEEAGSGPPGLACPVPGCTAQFRLRRSLKQHLTVAHLKEARHPCSTAGCPASFFTEADRARHSATKHPPAGVGVATGGASQSGMQAARQRPSIASILDQPTFADPI